MVISFRLPSSLPIYCKNELYLLTDARTKPDLRHDNTYNYVALRNKTDTDTRIQSSR